MSSLTLSSADEIPAWLDAKFILRDLLQISDKAELRNVQYACNKGENFASKIFRIEISFGDGRRKTMIVKSRPFNDSSFSEDFLKKFNVFPKEIEMYEMIERFEEILNNAGIKTSFGAKCLKIASVPTDIIVIEDLCLQGYKLASKSHGLDFSKMKVVLKKLAQFHASSAVYCENFGPLDEKFSRGVYNPFMKSIFDQTYDFSFSFIVDNIFSTWSLNDSIITKMKNWRNFILDELIRTMTPKENSFNCICHGDSWISNIFLLSDENDNVVDCKLIDFQQSVYASPVVDLLTLIICSAETQTKLQNFEAYIKFYHECLVETLKLLKYTKKIPTLKELYMDAIDKSFLAVWNSIAILPQCLIENIQESSSDNLLGSDEEGQNYKMKLYNNERYRMHMIDILTYFDNRGLLELS